MRIAVTGGCGFIGRHLVERLRADGDDVLTIDRLASPPVDVLDPDALVEALDGVDLVYHLAAVADVDYAATAPLETIDVNVRGTASILDAASRLGSLRVVLASTAWVYAASADLATLHEDASFDITRTGHVYTTSKLAAEMLVHNYVRSAHVPAIVLRFGIPYGPFMRESAAIPRLVRAVSSGQEIVLAGDGAQRRQFVDVRDLCDGMAAVRERGCWGSTYNLVGSEAVTIQELAELVMQLLGRNVPIRHTEGRTGDLRVGALASWHRAKEELGWRPAISLAQGVGDYASWREAVLRRAGRGDVSGRLEVMPTAAPAAPAPRGQEIPAVEPAAHDSRRFGLRVVRTRIADADAVSALTRSCAEQGADLAIARCPADDADTLAALTSAGWSLMDVQIVFEGPATPSPPIEPVTRRVAEAGDAAAVHALALVAFESHVTHYYADPRLPRRLAREVYADWARRMCAEPEGATPVLLYEEGSRLVHFSACQLGEPTHGELLLAGMHPDYRGRGLGPRLTADSIGYLAGRGVTVVSAVTGANNLSSQRQLLRCGLRPERAFYTLHRWFDRGRYSA
jgi:UDP-glucose 4-epimerase